MLSRLIDWSARNVFLVLLGTLFLIGGGLYAVKHTPLDALPDLSDVQVIVYTDYPGQGPQVVEDQVTYPLTTAMLAVPRARVVRGFSMFGASYVYVIFEDGTDIYWARSRVLEYLSTAAGRLPQGVAPQIGPDATGVGWVYQYAVLGRDMSLADTRSLQDWYVRYQLTKAAGVSEVASVGGFVREYQVTVDPHRLASYGIALDEVSRAIRNANRDVGGRVVEMAEKEYMVRGRGYLRGVEDIAGLVLKSENGTPVRVADIGRVELVPAERRGIAELNGEGEVASGIVMARFGQNALDVIANVKAKIAEIAPGLPAGAEIVPVYDRSTLIERAIANLQWTLLEESLIVAAVCVIFLLHVRSALVAIITLPLGILIAFVAMRALGMGADIMSLGGIAIAIGAMVDAAIVMIENAHKHLERLAVHSAPFEGEAGREMGFDDGTLPHPHPTPPLEGEGETATDAPLYSSPSKGEAGREMGLDGTSDVRADSPSNSIPFKGRAGVGMGFDGGPLPHPHPDPSLDGEGTKTVRAAATPEAARAAAILAACKEVGPALFFSLLIITVSFLPVFTLEGQEGRLFSPLAFTKTFAMAGAALLSVTLVPVLMLFFVRGRILPESKNPVNRLLIWLYRPIIRAVLRFKWVTIALALLAMVATLLPARQIGSEFMPTLNEGTLFYMPAALPGMSVTEAGRLLATTNRIIKTFPEVESVYGKAGRANTATDPAPLEMFETVINLKPHSEWRPGMTTDKLVAEMDAALKFPGLANSWTMPIKARIDMLSTGIRTPVGVKVFGKDLETLETVARQVEAAVRTVPGTASAYAERVAGGYYVDIEPKREQLARYGLSVDMVQEVVATALGGDMVTTTVEGLERYNVAVRYPRALRDSPQRIAAEVYVPTMSGPIPLGQLATVSIQRGAPAIRTENALLAAYVYVDTREADIGAFVKRAQQAVAEQVSFPAGYYATWSGQFENMERAKEKMKIVLPLTLALIFVLLYLNFRRLTETLIVMLSVPFALVGGVWLMWWLGYQMSVAVAVGFIALAGVAAETGVIMLIYLDHAWEAIRARRAAEGRAPTVADLYEAIMEGAVERVRPKMMTVVAIMAGLLPIMWSSGTGAEVMSRIAAPMVGGMISSTVLTLAVIPALYAVVKTRRLRRAETASAPATSAA
ncbi:putative cation efflux system protein [Azoarcus olearius]|uniref:efflux RND transporter permease subunit n=1 Tax=Azoarcus sp. (strain BH72) TaxID=418699 RepID=UPI0008061D7E|nr:CusA/CzcA family heavy metal efflux RND transporter [Azoarcus olearius]ANQ86118.1 putative cation efflux system protein [Azoarcus olearius]